MRWLAWLTGGVLNLFHRSRLDRETRDELAFHLAARAQHLVESGLTAGAAARQARIEMGGVEHYVTSFEFQGAGGAFGSLVPLPGVPSNVERGGDWTLQRLVRVTESTIQPIIRPFIQG